MFFRQNAEVSYVYQPGRMQAFLGKNGWRVQSGDQRLLNMSVPTVPPQFGAV